MDYPLLRGDCVRFSFFNCVNTKCMMTFILLQGLDFFQRFARISIIFSWERLGLIYCRLSNGTGNVRERKSGKREQEKWNQKWKEWRWRRGEKKGRQKKEKVLEEITFYSLQHRKTSLVTIRLTQSTLWSKSDSATHLQTCANQASTGGLPHILLNINCERPLKKNFFLKHKNMFGGLTFMPSRIKLSQAGAGKKDLTVKQTAPTSPIHCTPGCKTHTHTHSVWSVSVGYRIYSRTIESCQTDPIYLRPICTVLFRMYKVTEPDSRENIFFVN